MLTTIKDATRLIEQHKIDRTTQRVALKNVLKRVLAEDIFASINLPPSDNSAMDGYAIPISSTGDVLNSTDTIYADEQRELTLKSGECMRIMTGATIPQNCYAIVPIEDVKTDGQKVKLMQNIRPAQHIRSCAEDIKTGDLLLKADIRLNSYHIAVLASQGIESVLCFKQIEVAIISSGDELKSYGSDKESHQIYDINSPLLANRCRELNCKVVEVPIFEDNLHQMIESIKSLLKFDLIITTGGASVGDKDYTKKALESIGAMSIFDGVQVRPGKPTALSYINNTLLLNLPGNPLAAALCFELFGTTIVSKLSGCHKSGVLNCVLKKAIHIKSGRPAIIPGFYDGRYFTAASKYSPAMISPLINSNSFLLAEHSLEDNQAIQIYLTQY